MSKNVKKILKIKDNYSNLLSKKIKDIYNTINSIVKPKLHINISIKDPLYKQIIVSISSKNIKKFIASLDNYIANLNCAFKGIKSDTYIDFIHSNHHGLIVISNKVVSLSKLSIVKNYIKNTYFIDLNNIQTTQLS